MTSAPIDCFDEFLLKRASSEWERSLRIVSEVMGIDAECQVGDVMLLARIVALVEAGKLLADGDPWDMIRTRVRRPD